MSTIFRERCAGAACALGVVLSAVLSAPVQAQPYPAKPVRIVVGYPAGGPIDILARVLTPGFSQALGHQFIVDNRPGAYPDICGPAAALFLSNQTRLMENQIG